MNRTKSLWEIHDESFAAKFVESSTLICNEGIYVLSSLLKTICVCKPMFPRAVI